MKYGEITLNPAWVRDQTWREVEKGIKPKPRQVWEIKTAPHVAMIFKRMFPTLKQQAGILRVEDTEENCRNLAWFMLRYPMKVNPAKRLFDRSESHKQRMITVDQILGEIIPPENVTLAVPPRGYQLIAADIADKRRHLMLCDDTGVGKTATAICVMVKPGKLVTVVVTPTHLPPQWAEQIARFTASGLKVHVVDKGTPYDLTKHKGRGRKPLTPARFPDVIILSYSKLAGWAEYLGTVAKLVIFEEMQELRHDGTERWSAAHHLSECALCVLGLSATPFYNFGGEFWNVAECISPGELGTREEFMDAWCVGSDTKAAIVDPVAFHSYLKETGLMLRRTRKDVGREMPNCTRVPYIVDIDRDIFQDMSVECAELAQSILSSQETYRGEKMRASGQFEMWLRQATGIAKAPYVAEFVRMILESENNVVLTGWHREVYKIWLDKLKEFKPVMYTGSESPAEKDHSKKKFIDGESRVFILSNRSGTGLDGLQFVTRTIVIGELDWSPGMMKQIIERVDRDGQTDPVMAYFMLAEDGADPFMSRVLGLKESQIEGVRDGAQALVSQLQRTDDVIKELAREYLAKQGMKIPETGIQNG